MCKLITKLMFLVLFIPVFSFADNKENKDEPNWDLLEKYKPISIVHPDSPSKPRMPARYADIECYYCDGFIYISFDEPEGNASMTIEDVATAEKGIYTFSTLSPYTINIGEVKGTFRLEISTSEGHTYVGYLTE